MTQRNLTTNSLPKNIVKFIHPSRREPLPSQNETVDCTPEESILLTIKKFEKYSRFQNIWNHKYNKSKRRAIKNSFFKQLTSYQKCELEIVKANIESNLEFGKYFIGYASLIILLTTKELNDNLKVTGITVCLVVLISAAIYNILATQLTRLNWIKIAIAKKASS